MSKITISGYYGFNNIGDESILRALVSDLKTNVENIDITVLSKNPELTESKHSVKAISRKNPFQIISSIKKCDLLISGGGSLLQDSTSKKSIIYYLAIMCIGIMLRKKVLIYSQGIGPISHSLNKKLTKHVLDRVDVITLRDGKSEQELRKLNVKNPNIYVTADPVVALEPGDLSKGLEMLEKEGLKQNGRKLVGFAIRGKAKSDKFIADIAALSDKLVEELDLRVVFIPFHHGEDIDILSEIEAKMKNEAIFLNKSYEIPELLGILGNMDLLVGERLHSIIFSAVMSVPMIALSYDPKIENFMGNISESVFAKIDELDFKLLYDEIARKLEFECENKNRIKKKMSYLREKLKKNTSEIDRLLEK
ncbi:colanic acid biosynthesis protein [Andreesenia angusta]|uniref:Colanic acid biosynthesis protein n=1 Tax=Andreesenia angusta TaxID=39480 RepID=A0A1S1V609_9FIRM|nr:polysaccharide pyruvyl transferase CsaB [Andreesenia angusta]OHW62076.1 colanic acid biosynthesis protein [Andreesenia angusta]